MKVRRVVTGQMADGKSVFVSDSEVEPVTLALLPGTEFHRLWGSDDTPRLPADGSPTSQHAYFPPAGGFRWGFFTLPVSIDQTVG
ncbi:MAG: cupin domain-containing protein, partial [Actinomycetota bacterium]